MLIIRGNLPKALLAAAVALLPIPARAEVIQRLGTTAEISGVSFTSLQSDDDLQTAIRNGAASIQLVSGTIYGCSL